MYDEELIKQWELEEEFVLQGWDFSHIDGRWDSPGPPWDYRAIVKSYLKNTDILLDMGTGGGEILLTIGHPHENTYVTETYVPNFELCENVLSPLGITVIQTYNDETRLGKLPFQNNFFDFIINRQEYFDLQEVDRILKRGGYFITQQIGNENNFELKQRLNGACDFRRPAHEMDAYANTLIDLGYQIIKAEQVQYPVKFYDVGALVYWAKCIVWEFPGFSVKTHLDKLFDCHREIMENGFLQGTGHRFIIVAQKT